MSTSRTATCRTPCCGVPSRVKRSSVARTCLTRFWRARGCAARYLRGANLQRANLRNCNLRYANLAQANVDGAHFDGAAVYGIVAWNIKGEPASQAGMLLNRSRETPSPVDNVDNLELAQFLHLLREHDKLRGIISATTGKLVLLLGGFKDGGLERLRGLGDELKT